MDNIIYDKKKALNNGYVNTTNNRDWIIYPIETILMILNYGIYDRELYNSFNSVINQYWNHNNRKNIKLVFCNQDTWGFIEE